MIKFQSDSVKLALMCLALVGTVPLSGCGDGGQQALPTQEQLKNVPQVDPPDAPAEGGAKQGHGADRP